MSKPRLVDRIPFSKILIVLSIAFGVSMGLCGVTAIVVSSIRGSGDNNFWISIGVLEMAVMALSFVGIVLTCIVWIVVLVIAPSKDKVQADEES